MIFCDTGYLVRLYLEDHGFELVRELCASDDIATAAHAQAEIPSAIHRASRERRISRSEFESLMEQYQTDCLHGAFLWQAITDEVFSKMGENYQSLSSDIFLRASGALHLACARDHGFKEIYSNDKNLLAATSHFGLRGKNVIG